MVRATNAKPVADLFGLSVHDAQAVAAEAGMGLIRVNGQPLDPARTVFRQSPPPGSPSSVGGAIIVWTAGSSRPGHYDAYTHN